ncbi:patatin-like protein [Rhizorhapis sp. SPR117]|uniref:patatin-like protein n=1 Tax=Rhizorhapis sp. SPR117 TaxID=2912611 RepID=UPI001F31A909|nr:patatin-like protein [Rhizorhapis sp. SPR117]
MREKELRLALVCYGGISLAIYMHGITKEIWHLARASRDFHDGAPKIGGSLEVYREILEDIQAQADLKLRVMTDIITGASAGGINGIFLAQALETGQSLDPLTELWLKNADVDLLLDPDARPISKFTKFWAAPLVWMAARRPDDTVVRTVAPGTREEVRHKLSNFIRARWFAPPFGGEGFTHLLLDALDAMEASETGPTLVPAGHPLDLFVTVTDFDGHPERLRLNNPPEVVETEHRLTVGFHVRGDIDRTLGNAAELAFAARATASFPGAFPPFTVRELDRALKKRKRLWPERNQFLKRILPRQYAVGAAEDTALIDGSVLANAPFAQAIAALRNRPARREVDRRFVYIDPKPGIRSIRMRRRGNDDNADSDQVLPGFFRTIFGALSDIPREQPIRDSLEAIEERSKRIRRMRRITEALRPEIEQTVDALFGNVFFLDRPTPARLATWRAKAQERAARQAGFAYPAYGHLKLSGIVEDISSLLFRLGGDGSLSQREAYRTAIWKDMREQGLDRIGEKANAGASEPVIAFFRNHDLGFRIRRLRFLARRLAETLEIEGNAPAEGISGFHDAIYDGLTPYLERETSDFYDEDMIAAACNFIDAPHAAIDLLAGQRNLKAMDDRAETLLSDALWALPKEERRVMLLAYLGFPFYDIATLPLLQGEGLDEYDPVKVDRIAPDDATAIRAGGAEATLKGIEFNSFGAFFSRIYRENDYLWGRLHGADRLIDIVLSTLPVGKHIAAGAAAAYKRRAFHAILDEEAERLTLVPDLIASLRNEIG